MSVIVSVVSTHRIRQMAKASISETSYVIVLLDGTTRERRKVLQHVPGYPDRVAVEKLVEIHAKRNLAKMAWQMRPGHIGVLNGAAEAYDSTQIVCVDIL